MWYGTTRTFFSGDHAVFLRYDESSTKPWWYPRHSGVVVLDTVSVTSALWWLGTSTHWTTTIYTITILLLYGVSLVYHFVSYRDWLGKLDHIMIFYVIAITGLPYWGHIMPTTPFWHGIAFVVGICVAGTITKTLHFLPRYLSAVVYLLAAVPMVSYLLINFDRLPTITATLWLVGVGIYGIQLAVYTLKWPDPRPNQFGFRELQHLLLLGATNLHSYIAHSLI